MENVVKSRFLISIILTGFVGLISIIASLFLWIPDASAIVEANVPSLAPEVWRWGFMTAALATGLSSIAAAYAVATVGTAAMGTLAEKPELFGRLLIFVGLAEGIAIYGVIVSVLILNKIS
jgi:V/A-type H+-transporting ATPase subunit K